MRVLGGSTHSRENRDAASILAASDTVTSASVVSRKHQGSGSPSGLASVCVRPSDLVSQESLDLVEPLLERLASQERSVFILANPVGGLLFAYMGRNSANCPAPTQMPSSPPFGPARGCTHIKNLLRSVGGAILTNAR